NRPRVPLSMPLNCLPSHPRTSASHPMTLVQTAMTQDLIHRSARGTQAFLIGFYSRPTRKRHLSARRTYPSYQPSSLIGSVPIFSTTPKSPCLP
ncbi:hypothetical protein HETIRDRAFT_312861, partial [Heterobasidion irregulare TC 32-1]